MKLRRPNPFTPWYCPRWLREPGRAWLDGKPIDLVRVFASTRVTFDTIGRIEIRDDAKTFYPFREADTFERMPYPSAGAGSLARDDSPITDRELEERCAEVLGVNVKLAGGRDVSQKRYLRHHALACLTNELLERETAGQMKNEEVAPATLPRPGA